MVFAKGSWRKRPRGWRHTGRPRRGGYGNAHWRSVGERCQRGCGCCHSLPWPRRTRSGADGVEPAIEKRNVMAITSGVKADTDGHDRVESSSRIGHGANSRKKANAGKQAARVLRNPLTWVILVMNGRAVRCNKTSGQGRRDQSSGRGRASGVSRDLHATSTGAPVCHDGAPGKKRTWAGQQENSGCNERSKDRVCARSQNRTRRYESRPLSCAEILN